MCAFRSSAAAPHQHSKERQCARFWCLTLECQASWTKLCRPLPSWDARWGLTRQLHKWCKYKKTGAGPGRTRMGCCSRMCISPATLQRSLNVTRGGKVLPHLCWRLRNKLCWHDQEGTVHLEVQRGDSTNLCSTHLQAVLIVLQAWSCRVWTTPLVQWGQQ